MIFLEQLFTNPIFLILWSSCKKTLIIPEGEISVQLKILFLQIEFVNELRPKNK